MKKEVLLIGLFIFAAGLFAQESGTVSKLKKSDRVVVDLFYDLWQDTPSDLKMGKIQPGIGIASFQDYPIGNSNFAFAFGLRVSAHNMYSNSLLGYDTSGVSVFRPIADTLSYKVNKFTLSYLEIPVELRFRTKSINTFKISAGFKFGLLLQEHTKYSGDDLFDAASEYQIKFKEYKHRNISKFSYGPTLRVGYRWFNLYASYSMTPIFEKDKGPQMYPVSLGIMISPY